MRSDLLCRGNGVIHVTNGHDGTRVAKSAAFRYDVESPWKGFRLAPQPISWLEERGAAEGMPYPHRILQTVHFLGRSRNWPVRSPLARISKRIVITTLVPWLALSACRRPADADRSTGPAPGGELVASLRSEPALYNRYFEITAAADVVAQLTHARLVRVNRATDTVEPALAESWETSADGLTHTFRLRRGVTFSDGAPFTSADVVFSLAVAYDAPGSRLGDAVSAAGQRLDVTAPDPQTVIVRFPAPFAPGVRLLDNLPILPRHKLEAAFRAGTIQQAWTQATPLSELVGLGPFVLAEHVAGQRLVFTRNPHYWKKAADQTPLPYLDKLTLEIIPDPNAEALRLESGATDLMSNGDIRPDDYARFKRLSDQGRLKLLDAGVGLDPNVLWFNLKPTRGKDPKPWLHRKEFRQALSYGVDRQAIANAVYLGAGVPVFGPITPGFATWHSDAAPAYPHDPGRARKLLTTAGLTDRNHDGALEDASGAPVRFSILLQQDSTTRERMVSLLKEQIRRLGVEVDVVGLDLGAVIKRWQAGDYDSVFHAFQTSATDPAMSLDFWLSSGDLHFWNPVQAKPATEWEARIDDLMRRQVAAGDLAERQRLFAEVQRIFGEELPALYFVAPKVTLALAPRVVNATPAPQAPQLLWSAETLAVSGPRGTR
jgi:peptide/nickel transport system substrate-binding protein